MCALHEEVEAEMMIKKRFESRPKWCMKKREVNEYEPICVCVRCVYVYVFASVCKNLRNRSFMFRACYGLQSNSAAAIALAAWYIEFISKWKLTTDQNCFHALSLAACQWRVIWNLKKKRSSSSSNKQTRQTSSSGSYFLFDWYT